MNIKRLKGRNPRAVSLHHPTLRNCIFTITQFSRPYKSPYPCPMCRITHEYKTIHLNLNDEGNVAIGDNLYEKLKAEGILGSLVARAEVIPAPTILDLGLNAPAPIVMSRELGKVRLTMNGKTEGG